MPTTQGNTMNRNLFFIRLQQPIMSDIIPMIYFIVWSITLLIIFWMQQNNDRF